MNNQNVNQEPNPEIPAPAGAAAPIAADRGRKILKRMAISIVVSVGGMFVLANLVAPARCAGATRSAKLRWQERQEEINRSIQAAEAMGDHPSPEKMELPPSSHRDP